MFANDFDRSSIVHFPPWHSRTGLGKFKRYRFTLKIKFKQLAEICA